MTKKFEVGMIVNVPQGKYIDGKYIQPIFPVNDESVDKMLSIGFATVVEDYIPGRSGASWGNGYFKKIDDGEWANISWHYDSSG